MCVGIPMVVREADGHSAICESLVNGCGETVRIDMSLVGPQPPGSFLLTFLGAAREVMTQEDAHRTADAVSALMAVMSDGHVPDIDSLFPDLADREPQLPDHLKPAARAG